MVIPISSLSLCLSSSFLLTLLGRCGVGAQLAVDFNPGVDVGVLPAIFPLVVVVVVSEVVAVSVGLSAVAQNVPARRTMKTRADFSILLLVCVLHVQRMRWDIAYEERPGARRRGGGRKCGRRGSRPRNTKLQKPQRSNAPKWSNRRGGLSKGECFKLARYYTSRSRQ